jgi:hypothetical protein
MPPVAAPSISILVRWTPGVASSLAEPLARTLGKAGIRSTWAVAEPAQAQSLGARIGLRTACEIALFVAEPPVDAAAISQRLKAFAAADQEVSAIEVPTHPPRGSFERQLCQSGVRAVVARCGVSKGAMARPLPFGIWAFTPQVILPARRGWLSLLTGGSRTPRPHGDAPSLAVIDLARVAASQVRAVRAIEQYVASTSELAAHGRVVIATIGDLTREFSQQTAARPQRSILRTAA